MKVETNSIKAWMLAVRPKTLTGAAVPVMIGCALSAAHGGFDVRVAVLCFLFAFMMQIDANLINDLFDFLKGADRDDRLGPERACAQGWITKDAMQKGIVLTTIVAALTGLGLLFFGGPELIVIGAACILFAFLYTAGPYPLAYHGWGDVLVLVFFGFVPVGSIYYIMMHDWSLSTGLLSLACGMVIETLLVVNNFRDRAQDAASGKKTLIVRLGAKAGIRMYLLSGLIASLCCLYFIGKGHLWAALLPQIYLLSHIRTTVRMARIYEGKALNIILGETSRNMLLFGILLSLGLIL